MLKYLLGSQVDEETHIAQVQVKAYMRNAFNYETHPVPWNVIWHFASILSYLFDKCCASYSSIQEKRSKDSVKKLEPIKSEINTRQSKLPPLNSPADDLEDSSEDKIKILIENGDQNSTWSNRFDADQKLMQEFYRNPLPQAKATSPALTTDDENTHLLKHENQNSNNNKSILPEINSLATTISDQVHANLNRPTRLFYESSNQSPQRYGPDPKNFRDEQITVIQRAPSEKMSENPATARRFHNASENKELRTLTSQESTVSNYSNFSKVSKFKSSKVSNEQHRAENDASYDKLVRSASMTTTGSIFGSNNQLTKDPEESNDFKSRIQRSQTTNETASQNDLDTNKLSPTLTQTTGDEMVMSPSLMSLHELPENLENNISTPVLTQRKNKSVKKFSSKPVSDNQHQEEILKN